MTCLPLTKISPEASSCIPKMPSTSLAAARAYQTADAEDLAAADGKADALYLVVARTMFFASKIHTADLRIQLGEYISNLAADHHLMS